ncbi:IclR family transcriptional regulator [Neotabrizicola sp. sgz301269]|uniref:IclR family transcriptional regulator n=1 Tax=Neotabrizicola sp. sgz301269 TaxID=3276282 RepID=UPI00376F89AE
MEKGAQLIHRASDVLSLLMQEGDQGLGVTEIGRALGFSGPTTHRILQALADCGLVWQLPSGRRYVLGPTCCLLGQAAISRFDMLPVIESAILPVAKATGDTVFAFLREGRFTRCVSRCSGDFPVKSHVTEVGAIRALGLGAGGLAILSSLPVEAAEAILADNAEDYRSAGRTSEDIASDLARTRETGLAIRPIPSLNVTTISMPFTNTSGRTIGALSLSAISPRMSGDHLLSAVEQLRQARQHIAAAIKVDETVLGKLISSKLREL